MKCEGIWSIKNLPKEGFHQDYLIFLENKYEFFDPFGEHIYFPLTVWAKTYHILPLGKIAKDHELVLKILEESGCDIYSIIDRKNLLSLNYMKQDEMRVLSIEKKSLSLGFATVISDISLIELLYKKSKILFAKPLAAKKGTPFPMVLNMSVKEICLGK